MSLNNSGKIEKNDNTSSSIEEDIFNESNSDENLPIENKTETDQKAIKSIQLKLIEDYETFLTKKRLRNEKKIPKTALEKKEEKEKKFSDLLDGVLDFFKQLCKNRKYPVYTHISSLANHTQHAFTSLIEMNNTSRKTFIDEVKHLFEDLKQISFLQYLAFWKTLVNKKYNGRASDITSKNISQAKTFIKIIKEWNKDKIIEKNVLDYLNERKEIKRKKIAMKAELKNIENDSISSRDSMDKDFSDDIFVDGFKEGLGLEEDKQSGKSEDDKQEGYVIHDGEVPNDFELSVDEDILAEIGQKEELRMFIEGNLK